MDTLLLQYRQIWDIADDFNYLHGHASVEVLAELISNIIKLPILHLNNCQKEELIKFINNETDYLLTIYQAK